jgi:hypothetical protein
MAKVNAWRSKRGSDAATAMRNYLTEAERQIRVYGGIASNSQSSLLSSTGSNNGGDPEFTSSAHQQNHADSSSRNAPNSNTTNASSSAASRGLAALPLLCAAAAEPRTQYVRRLQTTPYSAAWWRRQEPLVATPGTVTALPEHVLLGLAALVEHVSLWVNRWQTTNNRNSATTSSGSSTATQTRPSGTASSSSSSSSTNATHSSSTSSPSVVAAVIQSGLWPLHNALLAVWMGWIVIYAVVFSAWDLLTTLLLGSRRTGHSLASIWHDDVVFGAQSVRTLTESHQPLSARVVGLVVQPHAILVSFLHALAPPPPLEQPSTSSNASAAAQGGSNQVVGLTTRSGLYVVVVLCTLWYWLVVLPWFLSMVMLGTALVLGNCFALIEWASHI